MKWSAIKSKYEDGRVGLTIAGPADQHLLQSHRETECVSLWLLMGRKKVWKLISLSVESSKYHNGALTQEKKASSPFLEA